MRLSILEGRSRYVYWDKRSVPPKEVFTCEAASILEADKLYEQATGNNPVKQPYVGCEAKEIE